MAATSAMRLVDTNVLLYAYSELYIAAYAGGRAHVRESEARRRAPRPRQPPALPSK